MGETPIFSLSQVVAPGTRITAQSNSRTPSDFVILAFFRHLRKPPVKPERHSAVISGPGSAIFTHISRFFGAGGRTESGIQRR
ncbi:hypothetical protein VSR34_25160 [Paraburkholderia sp. JHI2823]|uniref:hypothetical protein n=1 Tax=Paraburkholderia TaxID=1822464 RepID=UPI00041956B2|nr:hypothetical protein [Paraburkholderia mimosarum]